MGDQRILLGAVGVLGLIALAEILPRVGLVNPRYLPPFSEIVPALIERLQTVVFWQALADTLVTWAIGVSVALVAGVVLGILIGSIAVLREATASTIEFLRPIPSVALIPLAIILVGAGPETKISLAVYASVWPILFNTIYALDEIDPLLVDTARSFGFGKGRVMFTVSLPHAAPFVLTGIRMAAATALILVVSTEYLAGGSSGLGSFVLDASTGAGRMDLVLASTLVAGLIGWAINEALEALHRRGLRWSTPERITG